MYTLVQTVLAWIVETIGVALIALFFGFILANTATHVVRRILMHAEINRLFHRTGVTANAEQVITKIVQIAAYALVCMLVLWHLGILWHTLVITLSMLIVFCAAEIIINLVDIIPNLFVGFFLRRKHLIHHGKAINFPKLKGVIRNVYPTELILSTTTGDILSVPYVYLRRVLKRRS